MNRLYGLALIALILVGCGLAVQPPPQDRRDARTVTAGTNKMGVHLLMDDGENQWPTRLWPEHMQYARNAVGEWGYVTQVIETDNLDVTKWQRFMDLCAELHLIPILRLATTFEEDFNYWAEPPQDINGGYTTIADEYAEFIIALEWPTDQHFVIVGNEPNHGNEWGGAPDPAEYARFLIDVARAVHAADPQARILNAGFDPYAPNTGGQPLPDGFVYLDEETFINEMLGAEPDVFKSIDVWASHSYSDGSLSLPPGAIYGSDQSRADVKQGINTYIWEVSLFQKFGIRSLPVMITETGWRHAESTHPASEDAREGYPDASTVASYFEEAFFNEDDIWLAWMNDSRVIAVTPFAFNGLPSKWGHTNWLMLDESGNILGTYPIYDYFAELNQQE
jgi:hypothetical protein